MASTHRQSTSDLIAVLEERGEEFAFFQLVDTLLKARFLAVEERELREQMHEGIFFRVDPGLGFPGGDVVGLRRLLASDGDEGLEVTVNFLGLHGSSSPLPAHMLETAVWSRGEEGVQIGFNDFFSNRLIWLFYLIWRKYRYYIRYREGARDQFSEWMFALIGIKGEEARGHAGISWAKLLTYLGVVAARTRSAAMIAGVIAHAFNLRHVSIREFETRRVEIPSDQRAQFGVGNMTLGSDMTIGRFVNDVAGKFIIVLEELSFERFRDFLPSGREYPRLRELVEFLLKDQFAYDLELHFDRGQVPDFVLGASRKSHIGWTTFLGDANKLHRKPVILQVRD